MVLYPEPIGYNVKKYTAQIGSKMFNITSKTPIYNISVEESRRIREEVEDRLYRIFSKYVDSDENCTLNSHRHDSVAVSIQYANSRFVMVRNRAGLHPKNYPKNERENVWIEKMVNRLRWCGSRIRSHVMLAAQWFQR